MQHYPQEGQDPRNNPQVRARRAARRRRIRRNRIIFALVIIALLALMIGLVVHLFKGADHAESSSAPSASGTSVSSAPSEPPAPPFKPTWTTTGEENMPYLLAVNRVTQTVTVYEKDEKGNYTVPKFSMICSTGQDTEIGEFHTSDQYEWRYLVGGVYGQYATRIDGPILFHSVPYFAQDKGKLEGEEYNKLGTAASLGCVRLQIKDCKWIYDECPSGTPVVIFDGEEYMDPLGNPGFDPIDLESPNAGWDPTDPDPANPWTAN